MELQVSERLIDEGAHPKLDGNCVLTVIRPDEAPRDQGFDFSGPDLHLNDSLSMPPSVSIAAHALG
jgi:hypothetical protein